MTTWTDDKVWLSFILRSPKAVIFQYTRTVRTLIMEHQIFNKCGNTYHTIQEISTEKKKRRKTFSGTKEPYYNLSSPVITLTYWRYVAVRKKKGISFTGLRE